MACSRWAQANNLVGSISPTMTRYREANHSPAIKKFGGRPQAARWVR
jgi:hypothetical protein